MSKNISVELTKNVLDTILEHGGVCEITNIPSEKFEIIMPNIYATRDGIIRDIELIRNNLDHPKVKEFLEEYPKAPLRVVTTRKNNVFHYVVKSTYTTPVMDMQKESYIDFEYVYGLIPHVKSCALPIDDFMQVGMSLNIVKIVDSVVKFLEQPTTIIETQHTKKILNPNKNKKNKKKSNVRYVYKTIHKIKSVCIEQDKKKSSDTQREYTKEQWVRNGHFRHYYDKESGELKKKVWIEKTTCKAHGKIKENQELKITKI